MDRKEVKSFVLQVCGAVGVCVGVCLLGALILAFVVKAAQLESSVISPVARVIQTSAVAVGCLLCLRQGKSLVKGILSGVLGCVLSWLVFCAIAGQVTFGVDKIVEWLLGAAVGGIFATVSAAVRK